MVRAAAEAGRGISSDARAMFYSSAGNAACQLGQLEVARNWLARAIKIKAKYKQMALVDPDLKALH